MLSISITYFTWFTFCIMTAVSERNRMLFFEIKGRRLQYKPISTKFNVEMVECLGICLDNPQCKAYNVLKDESNSKVTCQVFKKDRSAKYAVLADDSSSNHFDALSTKDYPDNKSN